MRTTITLESDVEALVRKLMRERGMTFKQAVNHAIRAGLAPDRQQGFAQETFRMGEPQVSLTKALAVAAALEDEEISRKAELGK